MIPIMFFLYFSVLVRFLFNFPSLLFTSLPLPVLAIEEWGMLAGYGSRKISAGKAIGESIWSLPSTRIFIYSSHRSRRHD